MIPPFNYTGYYVDATTQWSTALRGLCKWTTQDALCVATVIPIIVTTILLLVALIYNCVITPQKAALMDAAALRDSPLWPVSLAALADDEIAEVVVSSAGLSLKDLFPLLGLDSLVQRAAALGLATLKDLLCANAQAVRDIGIEVREQRILARSLERIATHARKAAAEKRRERRERRFSLSRARSGSRLGGLAMAFSGGSQSGAAAAAGAGGGDEADGDGVWGGATPLSYEPPLRRFGAAGTGREDLATPLRYDDNAGDDDSTHQRERAAARYAQSSRGSPRLAPGDRPELHPVWSPSASPRESLPLSPAGARPESAAAGAAAAASGRDDSEGVQGSEGWRRLRGRFAAATAVTTIERLSSVERVGNVDLMDI